MAEPTTDPRLTEALRFADLIAREFDPQEVNAAMDTLAPAMSGRPTGLAYYIAAVLIASATQHLDIEQTACACDAVGILVGFVRSQATAVKVQRERMN